MNMSVMQEHRETTREMPRDALLRVAASLFARDGFATTSVRAIAKEAGVDPTLIIRHFGSKEGLFLEAASFEDVLTSSFEGPTETLGVRLVEHIIGMDRRSRGVYVALVRASDSPDVQARLRQVSESVFIRPLIERIRGEHAELRAHLVAAQISGLLAALSVAADPILWDSEPNVVKSVYGRAVQTLIDG
jgi:AcrR family transcriptional regulator